MRCLFVRRSSKSSERDVVVGGGGGGGGGGCFRVWALRTPESLSVTQCTAPRGFYREQFFLLLCTQKSHSVVNRSRRCRGGRAGAHSHIASRWRISFPLFFGVAIGRGRRDDEHALWARDANSCVCVVCAPTKTQPNPAAVVAAFGGVAAAWGKEVRVHKALISCKAALLAAAGWGIARDGGCFSRRADQR